jgi:hypothetical protein
MVAWYCWHLQVWRFYPNKWWFINWYNYQSSLPATVFEGRWKPKIQTCTSFGNKEIKMWFKYKLGTKGYLLFDLNTIETLISRNLIFHESIFPYIENIVPIQIFRMIPLYVLIVRFNIIRKTEIKIQLCIIFLQVQYLLLLLPTFNTMLILILLKTLLPRINIRMVTNMSLVRKLLGNEAGLKSFLAI